MLDCCSPVSKQIPMIHPFTFDGFALCCGSTFRKTLFLNLPLCDLFVACCHITKHISIRTYFCGVSFCSASASHLPVCVFPVCVFFSFDFYFQPLSWLSETIYISQQEKVIMINCFKSLRTTACSVQCSPCRRLSYFSLFVLYFTYSLCFCRAPCLRHICSKIESHLNCNINHDL